MKVVHLLLIVGFIAFSVASSSRRHRGRLAHRREYEADDDEALDRPAHYKRRASHDFDDDEERGYRSRKNKRSKRPLNKYKERSFVRSHFLNQNKSPYNMHHCWGR